jgi:O-antigen/teichoic acid export membrane protein
MGIQSLLLVVLGFLVLGDASVTLSTVLSLVVGCVLLIAAWQWRLARRLALPTWSRDPDAAKPREWLAASLPMMGVFLVTLTLGQSDLYFLEILGDEREVGFYAAADTTAHFLVLIQTTVVGLVAPLAQPAIDAGSAASRRTRRDGLRLMLAGLVPTAILLALAARPALSLFGAAYGRAVPELYLLLVGNFAFATAALAALWLQYTGRGSYVVAIAAATLVLDSALNLLLIPAYGMLGAAASTAGTLSLAALAVVVTERRTEAVEAT